MNDFTIIRRSMTSRVFSTVVTTLTVAVAVGLMLVLLSLRSASQGAFERGIGNMHMLVSRDSSPLTAVLNGVFHARPPRASIEWARYEALRASQPFEYAIPVAHGDSYRGFPVVGTTPELFTKYQPEPGRPWAFSDGEPFDASFEVVAGADAARQAGLSLGDHLHVTHGAGMSGATGESHVHSDHVHSDFEFVVTGILEPTGGPHDRALFTDLDSAWIIHAHDRREREVGHVESTTVDDLTDEDRVITGIYLRVATREGAQMSGAQQAGFDVLRRDRSITVADPKQEISDLFRIVSNVDELFLAMAAVVVVSSGIAIMLALYNSMAQRRRQIAVLRVLGCSRGRMFNLVLTESTILGIAGAVAGIALAVGGCIVAARVLEERLGLVIDPGLPWQETFLVAVATIVLGALAGLIPALAAYRTPVIRNLRPLG